MSGRLNLFRVKLNQRVSRADLLSLIHKELEAISVHIHRIDSHMNQKLQSVCQGQAAGMGTQLYYLQACAALDNGRLFNPGKRCCLFQDYALTELIVNALGKLPAEMYYSQGLRRLAEHDSSAPVSYIETLRAYLDRNMSITRTAAALYLNRSTLLERIGRIKRELGSDLQDPEERLRLQILLKAMEILAAMLAGNQS